MNIELCGESILAEIDFHEALIEALNLSPYYGRNLDALWDALSTDVARPIHLVWKNADVSRVAMGNRFDLIVAILRRVEQQDIEWGLKDRFRFIID